LKEIIFLIALLLSVSAQAQDISEREKAILDIVASERGLSRQETLLLYAIRSHENGAPGLECGIEQPCARYYADGFISLIVQADYAAWIISERYNGNLAKFSKSFHHGTAETDKHWLDCVRAYMARYDKRWPHKTRVIKRMVGK
jgi:hypothetical protein